jgi:hypothetical protein
MAKLIKLLSEAFEDSPKVDKHKVTEGVKNFAVVGKALYNNSNILETAKQIANVAESNTKFLTPSVTLCLSTFGESSNASLNNLISFAILFSPLN